MISKQFISFMLVFLLMLSVSGSVHAEDDAVIGTLATAEGSISIQPAASGTQPVTAAENTAIHLSDTIMTGPGAQAVILLMDETEISLGENATFRVDDYAYDPETPAQNKARYNFLGGAFYYISGLAAKTGSPDVELETPYGSIGIRGTEVWGGQIEDDYGIYVQKGRVAVQTKRGRVLMNEGEGTGLSFGRAAPLPPVKWSPDKIRLAMTRTVPKDPERLKQRLASLRPLHKDMIARYRSVRGRMNVPGPNTPRRYINPMAPRSPMQKQPEKPVLTKPQLEKRDNAANPSEPSQRRMQKVFRRPEDRQ